MASGTRTAPAVNGTPTFKRVSIGFIDDSGDVRSVSLQLAAGATPAQVEALVAAEQIGSQASIYKVEVQDVYNSVGDSSNAVLGARNSVYDNVTTLIKNASNQSDDWFIPAPAPEIMNGTLDEIDPTSTELGDIFTALLALKSGFEVVSARYTERREINKRVRI